MRFLQFAAVVALVPALSATLPAQQPLARDPQAIAAMQESLAAMVGFRHPRLRGDKSPLQRKRDIFTLNEFVKKSSLSGGAQ